MTRSVYVASPEGKTGKSTIALGLVDMLSREVGSVGVFRPLVNAHRRDVIIDVLLSQPGIEQSYEDAVGVTYEQAHENPDEALSTLVTRFGQLKERYEMIVILGSDFTDISSPTELTFNARIAANLGAPVVLVISGRDRTPHDVASVAQNAILEFTEQHIRVVAVIANRAHPDQLEQVQEALVGLGVTAAGALPEEPILSAPTVRQQLDAAGADVIQGSAIALDRESLGILVAGMTLPNVLDRLFPEATVITPGDRSELLAGLVLAHKSESFPNLASVVLVGGYPIPDSVRALCEGVDVDLPIGSTPLGTFTTAQELSDMHGPLSINSLRKIDTARRLFNERIDQDALMGAINLPESTVRTPLMFQHQLNERARSDRKRIVLPEATDDRILESAATVLRRGIADVTLLGDEPAIRARARTLGLDIDAAEVVSNTDPELVERFAQAYAEARAHKGMTLPQARDIITDTSYFATMMVHLGMADGMVSGAINTTAHTIRPSLEFIKTKPGVKIVSSVFLMCLADRVLAYGDCAVNPDPSAEQLADIAISSAETAASFGIEPRVAMLSYSTGGSGTGADVDKVREATALVRERSPELLLEGPIQYDAAIDVGVAKTKLPDSEVAGRATVFVFPDLNTGNNTYKAVQRSANAVAIGPVLQGLNRPVNDLSRGALVDDIVNTVAITAIQAQFAPKAKDIP